VFDVLTNDVPQIADTMELFAHDVRLRTPQRPVTTERKSLHQRSGNGKMRPHSWKDIPSYKTQKEQAAGCRTCGPGLRALPKTAPMIML
jgi:hypothetical protein